jgi:hypothetical protein
VITLDGDTGRVYAGTVPVVNETPVVLADVREWQAAAQRLAVASSS